MKIETGDIKIFDLGKKYSNKYSKIFDKLREIKIGECIKVTLDEPNLSFYSVIIQYFRKDRFSDIRMSVRRGDREGLIYNILKMKREVIK